ncbi:hypothetical protein K5X92_00510 [Enterobacter bugandensis]|uniref:hypothetical protein n=1 Tax=Enterobacter bugandensis TaxID=881260 RepID=UPI001C994916|nr:hypothetical protein [Enterobacter bugandensis]MBY6289465.1 hypothetical protein [Enterobacter bugandensis]
MRAFIVLFTADASAQKCAANHRIIIAVTRQSNVTVLFEVCLDVAEIFAAPRWTVLAPARFHDEDRLTALSYILHGAHRDKMLKQPAGLFAVAAQQLANLTQGALPAALDGADDCPEVVTGH